MQLDILLLDCSKSLERQLKNLGFSVDSGTTGFCNDERKLPCQIYEKNIIIYNPTKLNLNKDNELLDYKNITQEFDLNHKEKLSQHLSNGCCVLVFVNCPTSNLEILSRIYNWVPWFPKIHTTLDKKVISGDPGYSASFLQPLLDVNQLKKPIKCKLESDLFSADSLKKNYNQIKLLFLNYSEEVLGVYFKIGYGHLIILPQFESNDELIKTFVNRVLPKMYNTKPRVSLIDQFQSPDQLNIEEKIKDLETVIKRAEKGLEVAKEKLHNEKRKKEQIIMADESANIILKYYETAHQQEDVALHYLYKVIELLENKLGGEKNAKLLLGCNAEWNLIGRIANASYADIRHAPKPSEKIKQWTDEEIKQCYSAAEKIIKEYFKFLFTGSSKTLIS